MVLINNGDHTQILSKWKIDDFLFSDLQSIYGKLGDSYDRLSLLDIMRAAIPSYLKDNALEGFTWEGMFKRMAEKAGYKISFMRFVAYGTPIMVLTVFIPMIYVWLRYYFFV